jgi:ubiquinone/menaquinone biosynthesis C-methylase UbiE
VRDVNGLIDLTPGFLEALEFRDLLEMKLTFNDLVLEDYYRQFTRLICRPGEFQDRSRIFELFRYDRCFEPTAENLDGTRRWMHVTTTLTRHEAKVLLAHHDFSEYRRMLDIGGNSGELARQLCEHHPELHATVADLPLVCTIGEEHVRGSAAADRIRFHPGSALAHTMPQGNDLVVFKSFLHDWPATDIALYLETAHRALAPGGTLMIFERSPIQIRGKIPPYSMIYSLLFFHSYRTAGEYRAWLTAAGFTQVEVHKVEIEMPFHLITARRPREALRTGP